MICVYFYFTTSGDVQQGSRDGLSDFCLILTEYWNGIYIKDTLSDDAFPRLPFLLGYHLKIYSKVYPSTSVMTWNILKTL